MQALYSSPLIPPEWLAAHGWTPCRWQPAPTAEAASAGACPFAWAWMQAAERQTACHAPEAGCLILTTECDMMRRGADEFAERLQRPVFLFNVPATAEGDISDEIYRAELERLGRFLVRLGGAQPDLATLSETITAHAAARQRLIDARTRYSPRGFAEAIAAYQRGASVPLPLFLNSEASLTDQGFGRPRAGVPPVGGGRPTSKQPTPIALVGGPLLPHHFMLHQIIERHGGAVVLDATETGELSLAPAPDPNLLRAAPLAALARAYLDSIPTVHRRPNTALYRWLAARLDERAVRGILYIHYPWCDPWHAEVERMRHWAPVPLLPLVLAADVPPGPHLATRIEAFLESLR